jgi:hypothetical protein
MSRGRETNPGLEHSRKQPFEQFVNSYSEHVYCTYERAQPVENARDSASSILFDYNTKISLGMFSLTPGSILILWSAF